MEIAHELVRSATDPDPVSVSPGSLSRGEGKKPRSPFEKNKRDMLCDLDADRIRRKRNAICSELLLRSLRFNHGPKIEVIAPEPEPEPEPQVEPEPLSAEVVAELPSVQIATIVPNRVEQIKRIVCKRFNISKEEIESPSHKYSITYPRQIAMCLARRVTKLSLSEIAQRFGRRDHTTVLHGAKKIERQAQTDELLAKYLDEIQREIIPVIAP